MEALSAEREAGAAAETALAQREAQLAAVMEELEAAELRGHSRRVRHEVHQQVLPRPNRTAIAQEHHNGALGAGQRGLFKCGPTAFGSSTAIGSRGWRLFERFAAEL